MEVARRRPAARQERRSSADAASAGDLPAGFADAAAAVTTRLHGTIFAVSAGVPTLICGYGEKLDRLCDDLGLRRWLVSRGDREAPGAVAARFAALLEPGAGAPDQARLAARLAAHDLILSDLDRELAAPPPDRR